MSLLLLIYLKILLVLLIVKDKSGPIFFILTLCSYLIFVQSIFATEGPGFLHWVGISEVR